MITAWCWCCKAFPAVRLQFRSRFSSLESSETHDSSSRPHYFTLVTQFLICSNEYIILSANIAMPSSVCSDADGGDNVSSQTSRRSLERVLPRGRKPSSLILTSYKTTVSRQRRVCSFRFLLMLPRHRRCRHREAQGQWLSHRCSTLDYTIRTTSH